MLGEVLVGGESQIFFHEGKLSVPQMEHGISVLLQGWGKSCVVALATTAVGTQDRFAGKIRSHLHGVITSSLISVYNVLRQD